MWRRGLHLQAETETWDKGSTQEWIGVTLALNHSIGDMKPEEISYYTQVGTPVEQ
jgi:predicted HD phosphohydrolase